MSGLDAAPGAFQKIGSVVTASAASTVDFTSLSGFRHYLLTFWELIAADGSTPEIRLSNAGTFDAGSVYAAANVFNSMAASTPNGSSQPALTTRANIASGFPAIAAEPISGWLRFINLNSSGVYRMWHGQVGNYGNSGGGVMRQGHVGGHYVSTSAVDGIQILRVASTVTGSFQLYGEK